MDTQVSGTDLRFMILPRRPADPTVAHYYLASYRTFHLVWEQTFKSLRGPSYVQYSNDFTRQDYIQALFAADTCVGLDCVRTLDLGSEVDLADSWLEPWPRDVLTNLSPAAVLVNSYFTVHPAYRRTLSRDELAVSYILGCLSVLYQLAADVPLMLGMMRHDRSMHKLGTMWGATTLLTVTYNNCDTDLVAFYVNNIKTASLAFPKVVFDLFDRRQNFI